MRRSGPLQAHGTSVRVPAQGCKSLCCMVWVGARCAASSTYMPIRCPGFSLQTWSLRRPHDCSRTLQVPSGLYRREIWDPVSTACPAGPASAHPREERGVWPAQLTPHRLNERPFVLRTAASDLSTPDSAMVMMTMTDSAVQRARVPGKDRPSWKLRSTWKFGCPEDPRQVTVCVAWVSWDSVRRSVPGLRAKCSGRWASVWPTLRAPRSGAGPLRAGRVESMALEPQHRAPILSALQHTARHPSPTLQRSTLPTADGGWR